MSEGQSKRRVSDTKSALKKNGNETTGVWKSMLAEAASSSRIPDSSLLLLGRPGIGKRTLVNALLSHACPAAAHALAAEEDDVEEVKMRAAAIDYSYFGIRDPAIPEAEVVSADFTCPAACSVFIVEDQKHEQLLMSRLQHIDLTYCMAAICLDLEQPWTMLEDLRRWLEMLRRMCDKFLKELPAQEQEKLRQRVKSLGSKKEEDADISDAFSEMIYNIGIPIVVLGTRSDSFAENAEVMSPVIEMYLRQECIPYGSAIIYSCVRTEEKGSEKKSINIDLLYKYLMHRLYAYSFDGQAVPNSQDALFVPSGWDADKKLDKGVMEKTFESVVVSPVTRSSVGDQNVETFEALDDFLSKTQSTLQKLGNTSVTADKPSRISKVAPSVDFALAADAPMPAASAAPRAAAGDSSPQTAKRVSGNGPTAKDNAQLTNFFQNLLTKGGSQAPLPGAAAPSPAAPGAGDTEADAKEASS